MKGRRTILASGIGLAMAGLSSSGAGRLLGGWAAPVDASDGASDDGQPARVLTLFLCGDVMPGRGIDQILPHPSDPTLHETWMRDAAGYVRIAEKANGPIPRGVAFDYVWGDALEELARRRPLARIINLETSVTRSDRPWPKTINYRMHPANAPVLAAAGIDCCVLANNHVLDWGHAGLAETLETVAAQRIATAGAGRDEDAAQAPAVLTTPGGRVLVFAAATEDSGVPASWNAQPGRSGVHRLEDLSPRTARKLARLVHRHRRGDDRVVFSVHWGGNWGFEVPRDQQAFARALIDEGEVDIVHGHSSHHVKAVEVHHGKLVLYGCGDFLNDYEGIEGHREYRGELALMYFPSIDRATGRLLELDLVPTRTRRFRVERAQEADRRWMAATLEREYARFGCSIVEEAGGFALRWSDASRETG